ncbi:MAG: tRNA 4-thiouridine(8) synthase ThiI, partial [Desulfobacterales bacterium]|nr:tRNA 4-thiouridine(8) synthase ThiI [Desulfobacterales bacterium]
INIKDFPGPIVLIPHGASKSIIVKAASICAGYSKAPGDTKVDAQVVNSCGSEIIKATGISPEQVKDLLI